MTARNARTAAGTLAVFAATLIACRHSPRSEPAAVTPVVDLVADGHVKIFPETRQLIFGAGDRHFLAEGWSIDERDPGGERTFVWATARDATVTFVVLDVVDEQFLVTLSAYPTADPQVVTVLVNEHEVTRFTAAPVALEYRFVVPARWLARGRNLLTFRHSALSEPMPPPNGRRVAAAYSSILIGPQCLPLRGFGLPTEPRVRRPRGDARPALVLTGPISIYKRLELPEQPVLRYRMSLVAPARETAVSIVRIREGDMARDVAETRLARTLFDRDPARDVEVDLRPWSGKDVVLEVEFRPETCRTPVASVIVESAALYSAARGSG